VTGAGAVSRRRKWVGFNFLLQPPALLLVVAAPAPGQDPLTAFDQGRKRSENVGISREQWEMVGRL
jgi:hypothetical protein